MVPHFDLQKKQTEFLEVQILQVSKSPCKFSRNFNIVEIQMQCLYHEGIWNACHTSLAYSQHCLQIF